MKLAHWWLCLIVALLSTVPARAYYWTGANADVVVPCNSAYRDDDINFGKQRHAAAGAFLGGHCQNVVGDYPDSAIADATASTSGTLHVNAEAYGVAAESGDAGAEMINTVTLHGPSDATTLVDDIEELRVSGELRQLGSAVSGNVTICPGDVDYVSPGCTTFGKRVDGQTEKTSIDFTTGGSVEVSAVNGEAVITLFYSVAAAAVPECAQPCLVAASFLDTAQAIQILPPGWTFTSASGDFLTGPAVPESSSWASVVAGFALIPFLYWKKRELFGMPDLARGGGGCHAKIDLRNGRGRVLP